MTQASSLIPLSYSLSEKWGLYSVYLIKVLGNELFFVKYIEQCQKYYKYSINVEKLLIMPETSPKINRDKQKI